MIKSLQVLSILSLLTACAVDEPVLAGQSTDEGTDPAALIGADDHGRDIAPAQQPGCQGLQEVATTVLQSYQQCTSDAECAVEYVNALCINSFMCPVPINAKTDRARLRREAGALSFAYQRACTTTCAVAGCAAPTRTICDTATKRCKNIFSAK